MPGGRTVPGGNRLAIAGGKPEVAVGSVEFGEDIAKTLKLSADGSTVLWPQPSDDPEDPQNVRIYAPYFDM